MILIDSNSLLILIIGLMNPKLIDSHKRTSIYDEQDFYNLISVISDIKKLVILPNIWTEVDNLLNDFNGNHKNLYLTKIVNVIKNTTEKFIESTRAANNFGFQELGLTDSAILEHARECQLLITSDSKLSDYANAMGIKVFDLVKYKNERIICDN
ncbi:MAG: hypothetical protein FGM41_10070 [Bacteroidetes bacterium]|nr:hypothetical protein [Bacteroidota bacterium]